MGVNRTIVVAGLSIATSLLFATSCARDTPTNPMQKLPSPSPQVEDPQPSQGKVETLSFRQDVVPILQQHCGACHATDGQGSDELVIFSSAGAPLYDKIGRTITRIISESATGKMPPSGKAKLTQAEIQKLRTWSDQGASNN